MRVAMRKSKRTGEPVGRPMRVFDREAILRLRGEGKSVRAIAAELGVGYGTVQRLVKDSGW